MSKGPLREHNKISDFSTPTKKISEVSYHDDHAFFPTTCTSDVKGQPDRHEQHCMGGHDEYCSDENCTEVSEFAPDEPEPEMCRKCGKHGCRLKRCSRCKVVLYCSRDCQKKDWQKHKKTCKVPERVEDDLKALLQQLSNSLDVGKPNAITFSEAKLKAEKLFPGRQLLFDLSKLSSYPAPGVFLGLIADMHFYVIRHAVYIKDRNGRQISLFFYLDYDNPEPYFTWNDLQPDNYICIQNPHLHVFLDGQVGLRIDEASTVRIITER